MYDHPTSLLSVCLVLFAYQHIYYGYKVRSYYVFELLYCKQGYTRTQPIL